MYEYAINFYSIGGDVTSDLPPPPLIFNELLLSVIPCLSYFGTNMRDVK